MEKQGSRTVQGTVWLCFQEDRMCQDQPFSELTLILRGPCPASTQSPLCPSNIFPSGLHSPAQDPSLALYDSDYKPQTHGGVAGRLGRAFSGVPRGLYQNIF